MSLRQLLRSVPARLRRSLLLLAVLGVVVYLLAPQVAGARRSLELAAGVNPWLLLLATVLQAGAMLAQAGLTRAMIPSEGRPTFAAMTRIELSSTALSHTVPGGTAAGTALAFRLLTGSGVSRAHAGFAVGARGLGSAAVLNVILWLGLVVSIPLHGFDPRYTVAAVLGAALMGGLAAAVLLIVRREEATSRVLRRVARPVPFLDEDTVPGAVRQVAERLRQLAADPPLLARAILWSIAYWGGSAASLWVFLTAFGHTVRVDELVVAFGLANVVAVIPVTPRGLGVMEATLVSALVGFGVPRGEAVLGVLAWRLVSFWIPIPVGGLAYLSLQVLPPARAADEEERRERITTAVRELGDVVTSDAEDLRSWSRRTGVRVPGMADDHHDGHDHGDAHHGDAHRGDDGPGRRSPPEDEPA